MGISDTFDADLVDPCIEDASRWVEQVCGRRFYADTVATVRNYPPPAGYGFGAVLTVDDFQPGSITIVNNGTTLTTTQYQIDEFNGLTGANELTAGWTIRLLQGIWGVPTWPGQASVAVTAKWGWPAVPNQIKRATLMQAAYFYQSKDTRLGVAGFDTGVIKLRDNSQAVSLLQAFIKSASRFGLA